MNPSRMPPPEAAVVTGLRSVSLMVAAGALLLELSLPEGSIAAVVGTLVACIGSVSLARSRVRLGAVWLGAGLAATIGLLLGVALVEGRVIADLVGTHRALVFADTVRFGLLAGAVTVALRTTATRYPSLSIVELIVVALSMAGVVAAHRDGAINHPRLLSDWAWTHGYDPVTLLLYLGCGTMALLLVATLHERRGRGLRVLLHLLALLFLSVTAMLLITRVGRLPTPPRGEGVTGEKGGGKDDKGGKGSGKDQGGKGGGGGGGSGGKSQMDQLEFRDNYDSPSSQSPVAVVLLHDDYSPPLGYYYFRQTAFSQYNGHRLVATTRDDMDRDIVGDFPTEKVTITDAPRPGPERALIHSSVALLADHVKPFGLESPTEFLPKESPDPNRFVRAYDVTSEAMAMRYQDLLGHKSGVKTWTDEQRAAYTEIPDDPRYKNLADEIVNKKLRPEYRSDPFAQAIAISAWLSKESTYSLKSKHADAGDPTADFLFGDRIGYCVHFAHSAAFLLRARGLPARIAAGYAADESRRGSGSTILLQQRDAHAWAELYLDGYGWIIVDVAPERVLDPPSTPPDPELQRMLGELARGDHTAGKTPDGKSKGPTLKQIARATLETALTALALLYLIKAWRRFAPFVAGPSSIYRVAYRAALDGLVETGRVREVGETREHFADRHARDVPSLVALTRAHLARAFGSQQVPAPAAVKNLARKTTVEARKRAPLWRVVLGLLDPTSWIRSR